MELTPLWSMGKLLLLHDLYVQTIKHVFLPLLHVFVTKCYVSNYIALCLATLIVVRFLHLCAGFNCPSTHLSTLHLLLIHHLCYVDLYCEKQLFYIYFFYFDCIIICP